jgi:carbon monoxide dehydrogenase subunit G
MIRFEGVERFDLPPEALFAKLTDAEFLVKSLPDTHIESASAEVAVWKLKPKLAFISGSLETTLSVTGRTPSSQATYTVVGKGVGASSTVAAVLDFTPEGSGTSVHWTGEITALTGLLKLVPKGLIQSAAEKVIADVWTAVRAAV